MEVESRCDVKQSESLIKAISKENVHFICSAQVILSPAIALKELLENSLDAGATNIEVKLIDQGSKSIIINDNGSGVKEVDFESLTAKHHTSKLVEFSDLDSVSTFGFRGEALSSLCAVGKLSMFTRHKDAKLGTRLEFDPNGSIVSRKSEPRGIGTSAVFQDIFHTFPVRQKELARNMKKEYAKVIHMLHSYALGAKNVRINVVSCKQDGKKSESVLSIREKNTLKDNIVDIFGPKQFQSMVDIGLVPTQGNDFVLKGHISTCQHGQGRSRPDRQFFFVNNRPCDLSNGSKAINEIYHQYNRYQYPVCVIMVSAFTEGSVDINLTPDKRQVLIEKESEIWDTLKERLKEIFDKIAPPETGTMNNLEYNKLTNYFEEVKVPGENGDSVENKTRVPQNRDENVEDNFSLSEFKAKLANSKRSQTSCKTGKSTKSSLQIFDYSLSSSTKEESLNIRGDQVEETILNEVIQAKTCPTNSLSSENLVKKAKIQRIRYDSYAPRDNRKQVALKFSLVKARKFYDQKKMDDKDDVKKGRQFLAALKDSSEVAESEFQRHLSKQDFEKGEIIGQFNHGFIITRLLDNDLFIVDQHATDEKFRYEEFLNNSKIVSQPLVCAQSLDLDPGKKEILKENLAVLEELGFGIEVADNIKVKLTKVPHCDRIVLGKEELDEALFLLSEDGNFKLLNYRFSRVRALFASRACRTAVMIGTALTKSQMENIIYHMAKMNQPWNCPHGRPTLRHLVNLQMLSTKLQENKS